MLSVEKPGTPAELVHHGVKGMKWGVRNKSASSGGSSSRSELSGLKRAGRRIGSAIDDAVFELGAKNDQVSTEITANATQRLMKDLPRIKARHGEYGKLRNRARRPFSKEARAYRADVKKSYLRHLERSANEMTNIRGTRQYTLKERGKPNTSKYFWEVSTQKVQHDAVDDLLSFVAHPIFDDEGWIVDVKLVGDMAQMADLGRDFLAHQGIIIE